MLKYAQKYSKKNRIFNKTHFHNTLYIVLTQPILYDQPVKIYKCIQIQAPISHHNHFLTR